jgi:5-methylcytosine-specific restriction endonuclease McrA
MRRAYEIPAPGEVFDRDVFYLGVLCKRDHDWGGGKTLRIVGKKICPQCARIDAREYQAKRRAVDPEGERAANAERQRRHRALHGRPSRSKHGKPYEPQHDAETRLMRKAIRMAGLTPSVAKLIYQAQRHYWRDHPEERRAFISRQSAWQYAWRYKVDPAFRLHERQRNSERKARNRNNHTVRLPRRATAARFAEFDNQCAYCGCLTHLVVDHFIPRAKGGPHTLGNLLPACHCCNTSKSDNDPETWYRAQPFFSKRHWNAILKALGKTKAGVHQMPLL